MQPLSLYLHWQWAEPTPPYRGAEGAWPKRSPASSPVGVVWAEGAWPWRRWWRRSPALTPKLLGQRGQRKGPLVAAMLELVAAILGTSLLGPMVFLLGLVAAILALAAAILGPSLLGLIAAILRLMAAILGLGRPTVSLLGQMVALLGLGWPLAAILGPGWPPAAM